MLYRVHNKYTKLGMFSSGFNLDLDMREKATHGEISIVTYDDFLKLNNGHNPTRHIQYIFDNDIKAYHYFKENFYNMHSAIIEEILKIYPDFELIEISEKDLEFIWEEDENQVLGELEL